MIFWTRTQLCRESPRRQARRKERPSARSEPSLSCLTHVKSAHQAQLSVTVKAAEMHCTAALLQTGCNLTTLATTPESETTCACSELKKRQKAERVAKEREEKKVGPSSSHDTAPAGQPAE